MQPTTPNQTSLIILTPDELTNLIEKTVKKCLLDYEFNANKEDELLKIDDVCKLLKVSKTTVNSRKKKNLIPWYSIESRVFFKKSEVLKAMSSSKKD